MKEKDKKLFPSVLLSVLFVVLTGGAVSVCSYFYIRNEYQMIRNVSMAVMGTLIVLNVFWVSAEKEKLDYQKEYGVHFGRFAVVYFIGLILAVACPVLPSAGWPYLAVFTALALFSNMACGMVAGAVLLMISVFLAPGSGTEVFILYFLSGMVAVTLFQEMDETWNAGVAVVFSLLFFAVCEVTNVLLLSEENISEKSILTIIVNVVISAVLLLILVKVYSILVINRYKAAYQRINDVEYELLVKLKEKNPEEYYNSIHTAYLSEHIAQKLQLDEMLTKTTAYYLKLGVLLDSKEWENIRQVCIAHKFPQTVTELLRECLDEKRPKKKETIVILFAEQVVEVLQGIFSKDIDAEVDYAQIVDKIYHEKIVDGLLKENPITYTELQIMRKQFLEEKLYYDILR